MNMHAVLPWIAFGTMLVLTLGSTFAKGPVRNAYLLPAGLAAVFLAWSVYAVTTEGPTGFWDEHVRNAWSNQIWFDILMAFAMAWLLLLGRMPAVGMRPLPWLVLFLCTGSFGLFAAWSRCLYLEERATRPHGD